MNGKEVKDKYPDFAKKHKVNDGDFIYMVGDKIKILRQNDYTRKTKR